MLRATIKSLMARKLRLLLTAFAIVLGVGFMAGTLMLTDTATGAFDELIGQSFQGIDVVVQGHAEFQPGAEGGNTGGTETEPIPESVLTEVLAVPGVTAAAGDVSGIAQMVDPVTGKAIVNGGAPTLGNSWNPTVTSLIVREGAAPATEREIAIDASSASDHQLAVGQDVQVITNAGAAGYTISGIVTLGESDSFLGATIVLFDLPTAQRVFDREGQFDRIYVRTDGDTAVSSVIAGITDLLPAGFEAISSQDAADQQTEQTQQALGFLRTGLLVFGFVAVFVGAFIIFNTFTIIVTQRTRELGLLRAIGASRRQIMSSVLVEAVLVGLVASVVGLGFGLLLAQALKAAMAALGLELPPTATVIQTRTIVVALIVGTGVTVLASVFPARRAARITPIEALREGQAPSASLRRRSIVGGIVLALGFAALFAGLFGGVSNGASVVGLGAALTFLGAAILSPLISRRMAAWIGAPFKNRGISGRLGRQNAMRNPRRTAATASALMIGLGLVAFVAVFAASLKASASAALDDQLRSDLTVSNQQFQPFTPKIGEALAARPEFDAVVAFRQVPVKVDGSTNFVTGTDPVNADDVVDTTTTAGTFTDLTQNGTVAIAKRVADDKSIQVGDAVTVSFARTGPQDLKVVAIYPESTLLGDYVVSLDTFGANTAQILDFITFVHFAEGVTPEQGAAAAAEALQDYPNVEAKDQAATKEQQNQAINQVLAFVIVLLLLSIVIAVFGIVNTLGLSIYERVRELGLVRAVGMSRTQVKRMVRIEAVIIAVLGAVLGMVIGIAFGWALQRALAPLGIDRLAIPVGQLVFFLLAAALCGVLAAIFPARRAAKLNVLEAISYE